MMVITALLMSVMMLTCGAPQTGFTTETAQRADFKERDETNQTYQLGPGARVEVSSIRGPVEIVSADTATAEVRIIVEIGLKSDVNADFSAEHVTGEVYLDVPNVTRDSEEKSSSVRARIGAGGTPITISSVSGNIRLFSHRLHG